MHVPKIQQSMNTQHIITAFHIEKMCNVIIFIVSWLHFAEIRLIYSNKAVTCSQEELIYSNKTANHFESMI